MNNYHSPKFKHQRTAFYILLTYIFVFQLSGIIFQIGSLRDFALSLIDVPAEQKGAALASWWTFIVGIISLIIIAILAIRNKDFFKIYQGQKATTAQAIGWGVLGFFFVFLGQTVAATIEGYLGIEAGSENTANLVDVAKVAPIMIITIAIFGPILEEIIFRRVIFGSLVQAQGFWISAVISGVVFAAVHFDFTHILLYTVCGLIFAYIYHRTKRLLASIVSHILLNTFVLTVNLNIDKIIKLQKYLESLQ